MRRFTVSFLLLVSMLAVAISPAFASAPAYGDDGNSGPKGTGRVVNDDKSDPLTDHQRELKQEALQAKLNGKAYGKTAQVARGQ